jgi:hypothetical protein
MIMTMGGVVVVGLGVRGAGISMLSLGLGMGMDMGVSVSVSGSRSMMGDMGVGMGEGMEGINDLKGMLGMGDLVSRFSSVLGLVDAVVRALDITEALLQMRHDGIYDRDRHTAGLTMYEARRKEGDWSTCFQTSIKPFISS